MVIEKNKSVLFGYELTSDAGDLLTLQKEEHFDAFMDMVF